jgi:2'-5' RNA ligase
MEKFTQKWAVIIPLEKHPDGSEFYYTDFPLHITIAGVFATTDSGAELEKMLHLLIKSTRPFEVTADEEALFGDNKDISVMKISATPELIHLYELIHSELLKEGAVFNTPHHEGEGYIPHSTYQKSGRLQTGEKVIAKSISLIDLLPNGDGLMRKITKTIKFEEV